MSQACEEFAVSRSFYYQLRQRYLRYGGDGLHPKRRAGRPERLPELDAQVEQPVVAEALAQPAWGPQRISDRLGMRGIQVAPSTVYRALRRRSWGPASSASGSSRAQRKPCRTPDRANPKGAPEGRSGAVPTACRGGGPGRVRRGLPAPRDRAHPDQAPPRLHQRLRGAPPGHDPPRTLASRVSATLLHEAQPARTFATELPSPLQPPTGSTVAIEPTAGRPLRSSGSTR